MIQYPTVLILGAGASIPFGFLSGRGLLVQICENLRDATSNPFRALVSHVKALGFGPQEVASFGYELKRSGQTSVDAFLERRPEYVEIGKRAISYALIPSENEDNLVKRTKVAHWYEYLFARMADVRWEEFRHNNLSVITFNYDRSLEHYLFLSLRHTYGKDDAHTARLLQATIPIVHVYGQLGTHLYLGGGSRPYEPTVTRETVEHCAKEIRILHEGEQAETFSTAHDLLKEARKVCFLGFGYHKTNLERLQLAGIAKGSKILGSAFGLLNAEKFNVLDLISQLSGGRQIYLGDANEDVLLMLRNYAIL